MESARTPDFKCDKCSERFKDTLGLEKHRWATHPSNEFERAWAKEAREGFKGVKNSFYQDDPYY